MEERTIVTIPDLYKCFLTQEPRSNKGYQAAKLESERWLAKSVTSVARYLDPTLRSNRTDQNMRLRSQYEQKVFDSGELRTDLSTSERVLDSLMANMTGNPFIGYKLPIVKAHDDIYKRFENGSSYGTQRRFVRAMQQYTLGVAHHVGHFTTDHIPSLQEMLSTRQLSVGVAPLYHLVEYAHEIVLPDEVFEHPVIQALERLGADFVILSNDILSYRKEEVSPGSTIRV
ncbi:unnamed protein product [Alternaria alternata]